MDELRTALRDAADAAGQQADPDFSAVIRRARRRRTGIRVIAATGATAIAAGAIAAVLVFAPGESRTPVPGTSGTVSTVTGRLLQAGGPEGTQAQGLRGVVTAHGPHDAAVQVQAGRDGAFTLRLAPGRWQLSATSLQYFDGKMPCTAQIVVPTAKPVTIACNVK